MSDFKTFRDNILSLPGVWRNKEDAYFAQTRDSYIAAYKPLYPGNSKKDAIIQTIDKSGAGLRGSYELIVYLGNKYTALYFRDIDQLKKYINGG